MTKPMTGRGWALAVTAISAMGATAILQAEALGLGEQGKAIIIVLMAGITAVRELLPVFATDE